MTISKKSTGVTVPYYTKSGVKSGTVALPKEIFGETPNTVLLSQAVRVFLSNQRKAHAKTKNRGQIAKSKRKIYRQKGTGGARHGSRSAPLFVGGSIAHGPRGIENYKLVLPHKMTKRALVSALSLKVADGSVLVADIENIEPKTKNIAGILAKIGNTGRTVIVHSASNSLSRASRNIASCDVISAATLNAYNTLVGRSVILTKEAINGLVSRLAEGKK